MTIPTVSENRVRNEKLQEYWKAYNAMVKLAKEVGITSSNVVGEYTERICADILGLELAPSNQSGFDAVDADGKRVQIKGRRINSGNTAKLTTLWNLDFDYIVAVVFDDEGSIKFVQKITVEAVRRDVKFDEKKRCWRVTASEKKNTKDGYTSLTHLFV